MLVNYLKKYKKECILAPLFKMLEAIFELFVPLVIANMIDKGISDARYSYVFYSCGLLLALALIGLICSLTAQFFSAKAATYVATDLRHDLFVHLQSFSFSVIDDIGNDTMITRMTSDVNQVQNGINMTLRLFLRSPFIVFGAMIMAFTIDARAAMIFVVTIPLLTAVVYGVMLTTMPMYKRVQSGLDIILRKARENLNGARVIRAFAKEYDEQEEFEDNNSKLNILQKSVGRVSALTNPVTFVIVNAATLVILYSGSVSVYQGALTKGQVVALVNYMSQILVELVKLANLIVTMTKAMACSARIKDVFAMNPGMSGGHGIEEDVANFSSENAESVPIIEFEKVSLSYNGGEEALSDLSVKIYAGQTIGIIGGTGSGKSSIVNLIPRHYDTTAGRVLVKGHNVKEYNEEMLRGNIGIVLQKAVLFSGTIAENLRWGNEKASDEELISALKISQAWEFVDSKEGKLGFELTRGGQNLSGGQRQRLSIARALVRNPEILILDDSSSALDYATDAAMRSMLELWKNNRPAGKATIIMISQRTSSIMNADQIIVMEDGRIVGIGKHEELLEGCDIYKEIHESNSYGGNKK